MIAIDTSSLVAYLGGDEGPDTAVVDAALADRTAVLPPVVLTEILSDPKLDPKVAAAVLSLPVLLPRDGYWERAGRLRAKVLAARKRARLADSLIAQSCLDDEVPLVTRDQDFRHFRRAAGLELLP